jgi:hypothetical protein
MQSAPNQLIFVLNLVILKLLSHYLQTIKALNPEFICLTYLQSTLLNSINRLLIEYFILLQFELKFMISFQAKFLHPCAKLVAFNLLLIMLKTLPKMSSKSNSFNFQAWYGTLALLCSSSSFHFKPLKFIFLHFLFRSKLPIHRQF